MMPRRLLFLLMITVISGLAAILLLRGQWGGQRQPDGALVPGLQAHLNDVSRIISGKTGNPVHIYQDGEHRWRVKELQDYPADVAKVRNILFRLSKSTLREPKTDDPARLGELDLSDKMAEVLRLIGKDKDAKPLADLLIGKYSQNLKGTYIRRAGEAQAWLVSEDISIESDPLNWADAGVLDISRARVRRVDVIRADGDRLSISREHPNDDFALLTLRARAEMASQAKVNRMAEAFEKLRFFDVRKASLLRGKESFQVVVQTFDGMEVTLSFVTKDGLQWAGVTALYREELRPAPEKSADDKDDAKPVLKVQDEAGIRAEIEQINARAEGWYYLFPAFVMDLLNRKTADLVKQ